LIEIEYIVKDKHGVERLRTADKKAADAYDKALDIADRLAQLMRNDQVLPSLPEPDLEELTIYLARNARNVERVLRGKEPEPSPPSGRRDQDSHRDFDAYAGDEAGKVTPLKAAG
jgi:dsDNA-binding SOS-regulon protein